MHKISTEQSVTYKKDWRTSPTHWKHLKDYGRKSVSTSLDHFQDKIKQQRCNSGYCRSIH